jgi:hypothetical protein
MNELTRDQIESMECRAGLISGVISRHDIRQACRQLLAAMEREARLRFALTGAVVDYDHCPYQMATTEIERLEEHRALVTIAGVCRGFWYQLDAQAVDDAANKKTYDEFIATKDTP